VQLSGNDNDSSKSFENYPIEPVRKTSESGSSGLVNSDNSQASKEEKENHQVIASAQDNMSNETSTLNSKSFNESIQAEKVPSTSQYPSLQVQATENEANPSETCSKPADFPESLQNLIKQLETIVMADAKPNTKNDDFQRFFPGLVPILTTVPSASKIDVLMQDLLNEKGSETLKKEIVEEEKIRSPVQKIEGILIDLMQDLMDQHDDGPPIPPLSRKPERSKTVRWVQRVNC